VAAGPRAQHRSILVANLLTTAGENHTHWDVRPTTTWDVIPAVGRLGGAVRSARRLLSVLRLCPAEAQLFPKSVRRGGLDSSVQMTGMRCSGSVTDAVGDCSQCGQRTVLWSVPVNFPRVAEPWLRTQQTFGLAFRGATQNWYHPRTRSMDRRGGCRPPNPSMLRLVGALGERIAVTARRQTRLIRWRHRGKHPSCNEERYRNDEKCEHLQQARSTPPPMIVWEVPDHRSHGSHPSRQDARCFLLITMAHDDPLRTEIHELTARTCAAWGFQQPINQTTVRRVQRNRELTLLLPQQIRLS
jgi:hypothetical protein